MHFNPHPYQLKGIDWIISHPRCCLFWEMGLGKSVVTLTAVRRLMDYCEIERTLVIAPKKVAETTWSTEARKWAHLRSLRVERVLGTERQRRKALATEADIYVTSRDNVVWICREHGGRLPFDCVVIDELSSFKSPKSLRFKAMRIATPGIERVIGLTGTPAPNGLIDLWAQMYCVDQGARLGKSVTRYRSAYFDEHRWNNIVIRSTLRPGAEGVIRSLVADICLSMQASDYLALPDMVTVDDMIELPPAQMEAYRRFERDSVLEFAQSHDTTDTAIYATSAATLMGKLAQYANGAIYDEERQVRHLHDEKLHRLSEIVESAVAGGSGVLVFYQYQHDAPRIERALRGYRVRRYTGEADLTAWNARQVDVLLAHPASTAYGLNMQWGGNVIAWFGTGWNLELYAQANARLHRQGQSRPVTVHRLLTAHTVDERAARALESKSGVQNALLHGLAEMIREVKSEE